MSLSPPTWTPAEFAFSVERAIGIFREQRLSEARDDYASHFDEARSAVEDLLELTTDLGNLRQVGGKTIVEGGCLEAVRYLAAPPVSTDDLETLSGVRESQFVRPDKWPIVVETIKAYIDSRRFPWLVDNQEPTEAERHAAIMSTAAQIAARRILTARANEAKTAQESLVKEALREAGFEEVRAREIKYSGAFPKVGEYCGESKVGTKKADIVVGLRDTRILAIECKVSNSKVNSTKRIGEAAAKAKDWIEDFGRIVIVPCAVIAGVYNPQNLTTAQSRGLTIWWSHDIAAMISWISSTGSIRPR
jgi:hypothetical protein